MPLHLTECIKCFFFGGTSPSQAILFLNAVTVYCNLTNGDFLLTKAKIKVILQNFFTKASIQFGIISLRIWWTVWVTNILSSKNKKVVKQSFSRSSPTWLEIDQKIVKSILCAFINLYLFHTACRRLLFPRQQLCSLHKTSSACTLSTDHHATPIAPCALTWCHGSHVAKLILPCPNCFLPWPNWFCRDSCGQP